jgi:hypothetical protein
VRAAQPDDIRRSVRRIISAGDSLPDQLRADIVGLGADAVPALVEILSSEELALSASIGAGSAPVHAADLLGALRAVTAVEAMLRALVETQPGDVLFDALVHALVSIGEPIVEPALRVYAETEDATARVGLTSALAGAWRPMATRAPSLRFIAASTASRSTAIARPRTGPWSTSARPSSCWTASSPRRSARPSIARWQAPSAVSTPRVRHPPASASSPAETTRAGAAATSSTRSATCAPMKAPPPPASSRRLPASIRPPPPMARSGRP